MSKKDFRFWVTFIILIGLSCEAAFYYKHHILVKARAIAAEEAAKQHAIALAAGPVTSRKFTRSDFPVTLSASGTIGINESDHSFADIDFTLPAENKNDVDEGQEVTFVADGLPNLFFKGEIYQIDAESDPDSHEFSVKAMASNPDNKLEEGMTAQIKIVTDIHQNALVIPQSAVIRKADKNFVYAIDDNTAHLTPVTLGVQQEDVVEITDGAIEGKEIVTSGTDHIKDGEPVTIEQPAS